MMRLSFLFGFLCLLTATINAQQVAQKSRSDNHVKGEILFQLAENQTIEGFDDYLGTKLIGNLYDSIVAVSENFHIYSVRFDQNVVDEKKVFETLQKTPSVSAVQYNYLVEQRGAPNDPEYAKQWALAKINAPSVWEKTTGGTTACGDEIVVAVLEQGFYDRTTDDLQGNIWVNKDEIPNNNIDDDGDDYTDDYRGVALLGGKDNHSATNVGVSESGLRHGGAVAGVIGAAGNNAKLITGINWKVKMMFISGVTNIDAIVRAYDFVLAKQKLYRSSNGKKGAFVPVTNFSGGFSNSSASAQPILCALFDSLGKYGVLNFVAPDNQGKDVEAIGDMPTLCAKQSMVSVTATNEKDERGDYAFSSKFVHLAAPGQNVLVLTPNNSTETDSGTSFSTPLAAGAAALLWSVPEANLCQLAKTDPVAAMNLVKNSILRGVDVVPGLQGKTITGGRLNVGKAFQQLRRASGQPIGDYDILKLYPNPVDRQLSIVFQLPETVSGNITIANALGQIVYQRPIKDEDLSAQKISIYTGIMSPGLYFLTFQTNKFETVKKFVVAHK